MPRTSVSSQTPVGPYPAAVAADALELTFTQADVANGNEVPWAGQRMLLLVWNQSVDTDYYVTVGSVADARGRSTTALTQYDCDFGSVSAFLLEREGWQQSDNTLHLDWENNNLYFAVLALP